MFTVLSLNGRQSRTKRTHFADYYFSPTYVVGSKPILVTENINRLFVVVFTPCNCTTTCTIRYEK